MHRLSLLHRPIRKNDEMIAGVINAPPVERPAREMPYTFV
jgi:hypothetical protein